MSPPSAGIFGLSGLSPSDEEKRFFTSCNPLGFILFARNCASPDQVRSLTSELRSLLGRADAPILIDQEGGRVARLKPPHWRKVPPAGFFAELAHRSLTEARLATYNNARLIARDLTQLGINVDCAPLADVPVAGAHDIIGDRAYGDDPHEITLLASEMARGLLEGGVLPVLKHIPGHGRARADSHEELPVVDASLAELRASDFVPFKGLSHLPLGMTAHILYPAIDPDLPATLSPRIIRLIRDEIGFAGLLLSDDLAMKALKGDMGDLARESLEAGCDVVLHCSGRMEEMTRVAAGLAPLTAAAEARWTRALALRQPPRPLDYRAAEAQLKGLGA